MTTQPYSQRETWLTHCEHELDRAEARAKVAQGREYEVTRNGFTMLWTESLVMHFLERHEYKRPSAWLDAFARAEGSWTDFGWVRLKAQEATRVSQTQS